MFLVTCDGVVISGYPSQVIMFLYEKSHRDRLDKKRRIIETMRRFLFFFTLRLNTHFQAQCSVFHWLGPKSMIHRNF